MKQKSEFLKTYCSKTIMTQFSVNLKIFYTLKYLRVWFLVWFQNLELVATLLLI